MKLYLWEFTTSICFLSLFLFYTLSGDVFCSCDKTETYKPSSGGGHGSFYNGGHYYHK